MRVLERGGPCRTAQHLIESGNADDARVQHVELHVTNRCESRASYVGRRALVGGAPTA